MKHGIPTCREPVDSKAFYMRNAYHEFFWGPFPSEQAVIDVINVLDAADEYWDYDPFCIICGADPLPDNFVSGFPFVPEDVRERILAGCRKQGR